jgi:hypothetical protein
MSGELYRLCVAAIAAVGIAAGGTYLFLYRPSRWRTPATRDASGWVLMLWLYLLWVGCRVAVNWWTGVVPVPVPLTAAVPVLAIGAGLDAVLIYRLRRFMTALEVERTNPTEVCPACQGRGVVPRTQEVPP